MGPSEGSRLPPGKTWAEGKAEDFWRRWRRRIWFEGETTMMLEEGEGAAILPMGLEAMK